MQFPVAGAPTTVFVADDVDAAWEELGRYLLHDAMMAASYRHGDDSVASISRADTVAELREAHGAVPDLHDRRGGRLHPGRQTASAAAAVRWTPAGCGVAVSRTRRDGSQRAMNPPARRSRERTTASRGLVDRWRRLHRHRRDPASGPISNWSACGCIRRRRSAGMRASWPVASRSGCTATNDADCTHCAAA